MRGTTLPHWGFTEKATPEWRALLDGANEAGYFLRGPHFDCVTHIQKSRYQFFVTQIDNFANDYMNESMASLCWSPNSK